jgi:hypothetical protein
MIDLTTVCNKVEAGEELYMRVAELLYAITKHGPADVPGHVIQHLAQAAENFQEAK